MKGIGWKKGFNPGKARTVIGYSSKEVYHKKEGTLKRYYENIRKNKDKGEAWLEEIDFEKDSYHDNGFINDKPKTIKRSPCCKASMKSVHGKIVCLKCKVAF